MSKPCWIIVLAVAVVSRLAAAQEAVPVGQGSYAAFPPAGAGEGARDMAGRQFPLVDPADRPIPTNKLWTALLNGKAAGSLWMYPWRVDPKETGLELFLPLRWNQNGSDPVCDSPLRIEGVDFRARGLLVKDWGDWTLSFRLPQSPTRYLDVTVGEGMPIVWVEPHGVDLSFQAGGDADLRPGGGEVCVWFQIASAGRHYGVFATPGTPS